MEISILMFHKFHFAIHRKPVGMHVEKAHKDANHQTAIMEIFVLIDLLNNNNLAIGGCDNNLFGLIGF